ncbi:hypothetical protein HAX54_008096 [Datura stramonium]|uniref:Carboxypeptidase A inhibitor-like domain-containing protein n=1 Tax=Datura stramonium TaxID=4076 RepID=A0ABS8TFE6_DATST|nr:hypothetical protein [Datura stramonium]
MASKNSVINFAIFFLVLFTATIGTLKLQVIALRDMPPEITLLKMKLFPINILGGCDDSCTSNSDCGGFTLCQWCWEKTNPFDDSKYSTCSLLP